MIKTMLGSVREFKKPTILTLILIILEVFIEVLIPFYTADLVNRIKAGNDMHDVVRLGLILVLMAVLSLSCGALAGFAGARASAGFARNLRRDIFARIQMFSFQNIDHFSAPSLVTRMTTDIGYVQMAFMMTIRMAVRAPLMLVFYGRQSRDDFCCCDSGASVWPDHDCPQGHAGISCGFQKV